MSIQFGLSPDLSNTQYAPVAALARAYQTQNRLKPLERVISSPPKSEYPLSNQLTQVLLSILVGCEYLVMVNTKLRPERKLAQLYRIDHFAHQSTLSRSLDGLTQTNLEQLKAAVRQISHQSSRTLAHDWRGYLELDYDLSGLPCGAQAQGSKKGYFAGKKTSQGDN